MSNETLSPSNVKLFENVVIGKLTVRSVYRKTKEGVVTWSCDCASCKQRVQMSEADLLSGIYDRCIACTVRTKGYKRGKAQWEQLCRNVENGFATMDDAWKKYSDMVASIGVPTAKSVLQVIENNDASYPHYGPDTCYWDDIGIIKHTPREPVHSDHQPRKRGGRAFTQGSKYFSEVVCYSRQRHFSWVVDTRMWNGVREVAPEWASDYSLYLKAVNVPLSRRYSLNRIDPTKPMRDGNWYWCLKRRATYRNNLADVVGECGLPMAITPQTHPEMFLYQNIEPYITSSCIGGKTKFTLLPPPDMKERVSAMVDRFGIRSVSWDTKLCEEVSSWLGVRVVEDVKPEVDKGVVLDTGNVIPGLLSLVYAKDTMRRINQRAYNWMYRGLVDSTAHDLYDVIDLLGQPFSLHYRVQRIHPGLPLSAENHMWVLSRQMMAENTYGLPHSINAAAHPEHFLLKPGEAHKLFVRQSSKETVAFLPTANQDEALLGYIRQFGVDALDVANKVALVLMTHYSDYVVNKTPVLAAPQQEEIVTPVHTKVHEPVAPVVVAERTPLLHRACTAIEAKIIANRVQEEMFLSNCTMEEAIFKALSRIL